MKNIKKYKKLKSTLLSITCSLSLLAPAISSAETNRAIEAWKSFAAEQKNPNYDKWVSMLSDPAAIQLAKEWKQLLGYDAYDLLDKADIPAELKPGLVITAENKANYPWLAKYLTDETYSAIGAEFGNIKKIKIVPSNIYSMHRGYLNGSKAIKDNNVEIKFDKDGQPVYADGTYALLSGPAASSLPFLPPKNGLELNWNNIANSTGMETLEFAPAYMYSCTAKGETDREIKAYLWWWHFHNREVIEPLGNVEGKDEMVEGGSIFFLEPNDVRGLAGVRQRYASGSKEDDFKVYIPSLRRTRILTGSDSEDPLASGLELSWDDWRGYWTKTKTDKFDYKIVGESVILSPVGNVHAYTDGFVISENKCGVDFMEMELRPVYELEITDKSGKYQYSKQMIYIDKENYTIRSKKNWDPRGNLFRSYLDVRDYKPSTGESNWGAIIIRNEVTQRTSTMRMTATWENLGEAVDESMFDVDQLRDYQ